MVAAWATMSGCGLFPEHDLLHLEAQLPVGYETTFTVKNGGRYVFETDNMSLRVPPNVRSLTTIVDEGKSVRVAFVITYAVSLHRGHQAVPFHCLGCDGSRDYPRDPGDTSREFDIHVTWVARRPCKSCVY